MGMEDRQPKPIGLGDLIRFLIVTLVRWAQREEYGEIRITVSKGQIMTVHENLSYRGSLPKRAGLGTDNPVDAVANRAATDLTAVAAGTRR